MGDEESLLKLIRKGADVNAKDEQQLPPLHYAAYRGRSNTLQILLDHGAEVNTSNGIGYTPLMVASREGRTDAVRLLLEYGAAVNATSISGQMALSFAATYAHSGVVQLLLEHGATVKGKGAESALLGAALNGNSDNVHLLLVAGVDFRATNNGGKTALDLASEPGRAEIGRATVRQLLQDADAGR